ncbi:MFS transporter [Streptomyces sp. NPDC059802]|uniref:MFS transporter n=1 Tax=Streptomyces sp. NPDC059802 TaxID=3346952 RepID=UPI003649AB3B
MRLETGARWWRTAGPCGAFSAALLVSAFAGIRVGRIIGHRGPRTVMTAGSVLGVASLLLIAAAPNPPVFFAGWLLAGLAVAATFYQPAFATLTLWWAPDHVRALTIVTLAGGLASTVFAPLTAMLADHLTWRATCTVLALVLARRVSRLTGLAHDEAWPSSARPRIPRRPSPSDGPYLPLPPSADQLPVRANGGGAAHHRLGPPRRSLANQPDGVFDVPADNSHLTSS